MTVEEFLIFTPMKVKWIHIDDFESVDERVSVANTVFKNLISVENGYIEFLPEEEKPAIDEKLMWLWVIRPSMEKPIMEYADKNNIPHIKEWFSEDF